ncbi:GNAT family N-acetyltransferase [Qipengyuania sphaerica]|uniref:GNAT family N-acetyltransferase n=1 Tax=Qipengyuania sphaerica TaxID=2867243 RepID=UPI001C8774AC|nr:GNAT family N-acetyltransferase [Qipengyuania sphaerica]MBX7541437.1 N-acetyltransferase [Qipengyuania sphaerica]
MGTAELEIERRDRVTHGDYIAKLDDSDSAAKLSWTDRAGVRHAEHTFVPPEHRGKGIAEQLVKALVSDARKQGFKISPDCSYVDTYFRRHKDLGDLRA